MVYVELSRRFAEFKPSDLEEDQIGEALWAFRGHGGASSWSDLLGNPYVVILGEAGIGKTAEFKNQASHLRAEGKQAFFLPLESLLAGSLDTCVDIIERPLLADWISGDQEVTFFLDAIDDAKLIRPTALAAALRNLETELSQQWSRVRLVLSCRVSDWRPTGDPQELAKFCTRPKKEPKPGSHIARLIGRNREDSGRESPFSVLRMLPLSTDQKGMLARHYRVNGLEQFMKALEDTDLERLAGRPRDLERLVTYWNEHSEFGSYREMLEYSITTRLEEHHPHIGEQRPLSPEQARYAAERVAAAMLLCQSFRVRIPDPVIAPLSDETQALEVVDLLRDFNQAQQTALLSRPIFDPATYGRVRFHDREILEYLAACWFTKRLSGGASSKGLGDLFLPTVYGRSLCPPRIARTRAVNPTLRGALPWLAACAPKIRRMLQAIDPTLLLLGGDPQQLTFKERKRAFRSFCSKYRSRRGLNWFRSRADYKKVATADMAEEVAHLLGRYRRSDAVRLLLLDVIQSGAYANAERELLRIAQDDSDVEHLRCIAINVIAEIGTPDAKRAVANMVACGRRQPNAIVASVIRCAYPELMNSQMVLELAKQSAREITNKPTGLPRAIEEHVVSHCPVSELDLLVQGLVDLYPQPLPNRSPTAKPAHFWWIPNALVAAVARGFSILSEGSVPSEIQFSAAELVIRHRATGGDHFLNTEALDKCVRKSPTLKRSLLVRAAARIGYKTYESSGLNFNSPTHTTVQDVPWIIEQLNASGSDSEREFWFDYLLMIWRDSERPGMLKAQIDGLAQRYSVLKPKAEAWFNPPTSPFVEQHEHWKREEEARKREEALQIQENRSNLESRIDDIRSGKDLNAIRVLIAEASRLSHESRSLLSAISPEDLRSDYGNALVDATRSGLKLAWRTLENPPPPADGRIPWDNHIALVGIRLDLEDGLVFSSLSESEAELAARFALQELNGFPEWIDRLTAGKTEAVLRVFQEQIDLELANTETPNFHPPLLSDLAHASPLVTGLSAPVILDLLEANFRPNNSSLRYGLDVIMNAGTRVKSRLARLSELRVHQYTVTDAPDHLILWIRSWLYAEPEPAWSWTEHLLAGDGPRQNSLAIRCASAINGLHRNPSVMEDRWNLPIRVLNRMIRAFVRLVKPKDDIWHEGVYSPGARDAAQDFRNALFQKLSEIPGWESDQALRRLAADPCLEDVKEFIMRRIEEHRHNDARRAPWTPAQVVAFERNPKNETLWTRHIQWIQSHTGPVIVGYWASLLSAVLALATGLYYSVIWLLCHQSEIFDRVKAFWPF